jgi:hypothetical protein
VGGGGGGEKKEKEWEEALGSSFGLKLGVYQERTDVFVIAEGPDDPVPSEVAVFEEVCPPFGCQRAGEGVERENYG